MRTTSQWRPAARGVAVVLVLGLASAWPVVPAQAAELLISSYNPNGAVSQVLQYDAKTGAALDTGEGAGPGVFIGPAVPGGHGGLNRPYGLLLGTDGNVYVASFGTNSVKRYDGATGHYIDDFVAAGSGTLSGPWGMTWGPDGNLYVAGNSNNKILRYQGPGGASPGAFIDEFVPAGSGGLSGPRGLIFGNDQWAGPGLPPGPAQDGYPDLYVASTLSGKVLRYHGLTGAYVDVFADVQLRRGGLQPSHMIYEQFFRRNDFLHNQIYTGNMLIATQSNLEIHQGSSSDQESANLGLADYGFWGGFPNADGISYNGNPVWGPNHSTDAEKRQSLFLPDYWGGAIKLVGANEGAIPPLIPSGISRPTGLLIKCGRNPGTLIRKVTQNRILRGTTSTVRLHGDNLAALMPDNGGAVSLKKMRAQGDGGAIDGTVTVAGQNYRMDGNDLLVDFTPGGSSSIEGGHYAIQPTDPCKNAMWFPEAVLVYMPALTNASFETGRVSDRENQNICEDPGANGNKSRPRHWDHLWGGTGFNPDGGGNGANQFSFRRDGNVWHPCVGSAIGGVTGLHYASLQHNFTLDGYHSGMFQSIAAPNVVNGMSTEPYSVYFDARLASWQQISTGRIHLIDGNNYNGTVIAETTIANTQAFDGGGIARSPEFVATVPAGYAYASDPPILTIAFLLYHAASDVGPPGRNEAALHVDNLRNRYRTCNRTPWADVDEDGDADQVDFADLQRCITGGNVSEECYCFDRDDDGDVDESDIVEFVTCSSGPAVAITGAGCQ